MSASAIVSTGTSMGLNTGANESTGMSESTRA